VLIASVKDEATAGSFFKLRLYIDFPEVLALDMGAPSAHFFVTSALGVSRHRSCERCKVVAAGTLSVQRVHQKKKLNECSDATAFRQQVLLKVSFRLYTYLHVSSRRQDFCKSIVKEKRDD